MGRANVQRTGVCRALQRRGDTGRTLKGQALLAPLSLRAWPMLFVVVSAARASPGLDLFKPLWAAEGGGKISS